MELELKKTCLDAYETSAELTLTQEETAETIVPFPAVVLRGLPAAGNWRQGRKRPPAALLPPLPPLRMSTESRSADTVCSAGTGYSEILNSFRKIPLSALGDFHTMIRIQLAPF